ILLFSFGILGFGQAGSLQFSSSTYSLPENSYNIFPPGTTPNQSIANNLTVELGVRFRSDVPGVVTGIRFYKGGVNDNGSHTGSLWTNGGQVLATGTFTNETALGWQQLNFSSPVAINANTTYVASYNTGGSFYYNLHYYETQGVDNAPLHAL